MYLKLWAIRQQHWTCLLRTRFVLFGRTESFMCIFGERFHNMIAIVTCIRSNRSSTKSRSAPLTARFFTMARVTPSRIEDPLELRYFELTNFRKYLKGHPR